MVVLADATIKAGILTDAVLWGLRTMLGVTFIVHGLSKFNNPEFVGWMSTFGITPEFALVIAFAELVPGILLVFGVLSRISASIIAIIMLAAMIILRGLSSFTGEGGYESELALLAAALVIIVVGPGRLAIASVIRVLPRPLH